MSAPASPSSDTVAASIREASEYMAAAIELKRGVQVDPLDLFDWQHAYSDDWVALTARREFLMRYQDAEKWMLQHGHHRGPW